MTDIQNRLFLLRDQDYADFTHKLTPNLPGEKFIGVRVPLLRSFAKELSEDEISRFLAELPHLYYEENLLHSILVGKMKNFHCCLEAVCEFLPYVDNWAVCDTLKPCVFSKNKAVLIKYIKDWISSPETYTCRFGVDMLMTYYLDGDFKPEYPVWLLDIKSDEYYVKMMIAWYFATALYKQWHSVIKHIEEKRLPVWTHNKAIVKALESRRITPSQKDYLKTLKIQKE